MDTIEISALVEAFFSACPKRTFSQGEVIVHAGEEPEHVYYIVSGQVNQYDISPRGKQAIVNIFRPKAFFPMSWALNKTPNNYFFEARTNVAARLAPPAKVVAFLQQNPDVALDLLSRVYRGVDGVLRRMAHLMGGDAMSRLSFELLNAAYRFGEIDENGAMFIKLNEGDLAEQTGLARETVNRLIQKLKGAGIVDITRTGIALTDMHRLEADLGSDL